eukprot:4272281-Amphidinium_carterae.1
MSWSTVLKCVPSTGGLLYVDGKEVGRAVNVSTAEGQAKARAMAGSVEWILLEFGEWAMIPAENIVAACDGGPTRVAARVENASQVMGAAFALQIGVDALMVPSGILETALIAKSQRGEAVQPQLAIATIKFGLERFEIVKVDDGGVGQRVCVDLTSLLDLGEGMLTGSSSSSMVLVHSETVPSEFVPSRPFRVNAGAVHAYILMADDSTKYLSELRMGDAVAIVNGNGSRRVGIVGRCKVERRPFLLVTWRDSSGQEAGTLLQQAETVRLVQDSKDCVSVTSLEPGTQVLGWVARGARHVGKMVSGQVDEH